MAVDRFIFIRNFYLEVKDALTVAKKVASEAFQKAKKKKKR